MRHTSVQIPRARWCQLGGGVRPGGYATRRQLRATGLRPTVSASPPNLRCLTRRRPGSCAYSCCRERQDGAQRWVQTIPVQSKEPFSSQQQTTYSPSSSPVSQPGSTQGMFGERDNDSRACTVPAEPSSSEASTATTASTAIERDPDIPDRWRTFVDGFIARPCLSRAAACEMRAREHFPGRRYA